MYLLYVTFLIAGHLSTGPLNHHPVSKAECAAMRMAIIAHYRRTHDPDDVRRAVCVPIKAPGLLA